MRAREEGRSGPFAQTPRKEPEKKKAEDKVVHTRVVPRSGARAGQTDRAYESLSEARREAGEDQVPFHKFAEVVKGQVKKLRDSGSAEVAFRVAVKNGKVALYSEGAEGRV